MIVLKIFDLMGGFCLKKSLKVVASTVVATSALVAPFASPMVSFAQSNDASTNTPIKHTIVIYQENRSFDNYFGTYPTAPGFHALPGTPTVNNIPPGSMNLDANGNPHSPQNLDNTLKTKDVDHGYNDMIKGYDNGKMDMVYQVNEAKAAGTGDIAMGYYDYKAIPALWQYAQHFTLADNFFSAVWGPSTPNALYLIAAQSGTKDKPITGDPAPKDGFGPDQAWGPLTYNLTYKNIGDELSAKGISWAWYQSGYAAKDSTYSSHHNPFQYFQNYEDGKYNNNLKDYNNLATDIANGKLPAVSFVKAGYDSDEHPSNSDPSGESFTVKTINAIMKSPYWKDTAIIVTYDESGGYWDHVAPPQVTPGPDGLQGDGTRMPALVVSPYAKQNYVSHVQYDTTSILKFIETNYGVSALNNRDANANNLLDAFDFNHPDFTPYIFNDGTSAIPSKYGQSVKVMINNAQMATGTVGEAPFINKGNHTMVPVADFARNINAAVHYDSKSDTVILVHGKDVVQFQEGKDHASVNGLDMKLDSKVWQSPTEHMYIPLSSISKLFGFDVSYNNGVVTIITK
jgi:phospholipase C